MKLFKNTMLVVCLALACQQSPAAYSGGWVDVRPASHYFKGTLNVQHNPKVGHEGAWIASGKYSSGSVNFYAFDVKDNESCYCYVPTSSALNAIAREVHSDMSPSTYIPVPIFMSGSTATVMSVPICSTTNIPFAWIRDVFGRRINQY